MRLIIFIFCCWLPIAVAAQEMITKDAILGRWLINPKKNLIVYVYLSGNKYQAKIDWFANPHNPIPPDQQVDGKNPIPALRSRKVMGSDVLEGLTYNPKTHHWEGGKIYDATSGRTWSAAAYIDKAGDLIVRGYWEFEIFGRSLVFKRVK